MCMTVETVVSVYFYIKAASFIQKHNLLLNLISFPLQYFNSPGFTFLCKNLNRIVASSR